MMVCKFGSKGFLSTFMHLNNYHKFYSIGFRTTVILGTEEDSMNDPVVLLPHIIEGETDIGGVYSGINPTALLPRLGDRRK